MFERIKRLWKLSEPEGVNLKKMETLWDKIPKSSEQLPHIITTEKARFIARIKEDPIKKIINEQA